MLEKLKNLFRQIKWVSDRQIESQESLKRAKLIMSANPSELDLLRQRNAGLEAEREEKRISASSFMEEIVKLKKKNAGLFAENFDLKREVAKLREEHVSRIENVESRLAKVEQGSSVKDEQLQDVSSEALAVDAPDSVIDASEDRSNNTSSSAENEEVLVKSREGVESRLAKVERMSNHRTSSTAAENEQGSPVVDEEMEAFLIKQHKKSVSDRRGVRKSSRNFSTNRKQPLMCHLKTLLMK